MKNVARHFLLGILLLFFHLSIKTIPLFAEESTDQDKISTEADNQKPVESEDYRMSPPVVPVPQEYGASPDDVEKSFAELACGNKTLDQGEECDDGNKKDGDGCSTDCKKEKSVCGNGNVEAGEECGEKDLPGCLPPKECQSCACVTPAAVCGNGKTEEGERCGEPGLGACLEGYKCESCACVSLGPSVCGNGAAEAGEDCNEPGLTCSPGLTCDPACHCVAPGCGNGVKESGEICGEPGLAQCPAGLICNHCQCTPSNCSFYSCPGNSSCQIQYCRDESGACTWGSVEGSGETTRSSTGNISVPECSAQVNYQTTVRYNTCTGQVVSLQVDVTSVTSSGGTSCPIQEQTFGSPSPNGQIVGCADSIEPNSATASATSSGDSATINVQCVDCCGSSKTVQKTLPSLPTTAPVPCDHPSECPT